MGLWIILIDADMCMIFICKIKPISLVIYNILKDRRGILGIKCKRFSCCTHTCIMAHLNLIYDRWTSFMHTQTHTNKHDEYYVIKITVTYVDAIHRTCIAKFD